MILNLQCPNCKAPKLSNAVSNSVSAMLKNQADNISLLCFLWLCGSLMISFAQAQNIGANPLAQSPNNAGSSTTSRTPNKPSISSPFGTRSSPFTGEDEQHDGLASWQSNFGHMWWQSQLCRICSWIRYLVEIDHGQGYPTRYGHVQTLLVKTGDQVNNLKRLPPLARPADQQVRTYILK